MSYFDKIKNKRPDRFIRQVGISLVNFQNLLQAVENEIKSNLEKNPLKRRGKKSELALADRLLLTLLYLREYSTFDRLGERFDISESYTCKIYHQISDILVKVLKLKNRKALLEEPLKAILIDVTEQAIERRTKGQKEYYSGKKNAIPLKYNCWFV
ncbi:MAG: transposase family protein [Desulfamplus sp.]|nr:transposase family protein [Desulfamplus sp.]